MAIFISYFRGQVKAKQSFCAPFAFLRAHLAVA